MQIRAATRQDEPIIRTIISQALEELGIQLDLEGRDSDLKNIERNYFWYDGLCLVAERDGQIIGVLAAKPNRQHAGILELSRLAVTPGARKRGAARALMKTLIFFAGNMECKRILLGVPGLSEDLKTIDPSILKRFGFVQDESGLWSIGVNSNANTRMS